MQYVDPSVRYPAGFVLNEGDKDVTMDMGVTFEQTWRAMEGLVDAGHVRQIGLANVKVTTVCDVMKYARIKPTVVQVELNPYLT